MRRALLGVAIAAVAFSGVASAQNTFCERYSTADEAASQYGLISAVVARAVLGADAATTGTIAVTGLVNEPNNKGYFNGTLAPFVDFTAGGAPFTTLATHLYQFFTLALGCRTASMNASYAWTPVQMYAKHSAMGITPTIMNAFIGEVGTSLASFGVPLGDGGAATELGFLGALLSQFNRYPTTPSSATSPILGNGLMICTAASCPLAKQIVQFHVDDSNVITQLGAPTVTTATIAAGDYVNFRFSATGGVVETDSATGTTAKSGGIASTVGTRTYTTQMNTAGTYYFYALGNASGTKVAITVTAAMSSSASMMSTGSMTGSMSTGSMTSTGRNAASSSATLGFATVLAVAAAVAAVVA